MVSLLEYFQIISPTAILQPNSQLLTLNTKKEVYKRFIDSGAGIVDGGCPVWYHQLNDQKKEK